MDRKKVLFICSQNAARSQMAEGYLRACYGDRYEAFSAGTRASTVNRLAIRVMMENGIDISHQRSKSIQEFHGHEMDVVVILCDTSKGICPFYPWTKETLHMTFPDPGEFTGNEEEQLHLFRSLRNRIQCWIDEQFGDH